MQGKIVYKALKHIGSYTNNSKVAILQMNIFLISILIPSGCLPE